MGVSAIEWKMGSGHVDQGRMLILMGWCLVSAVVGGLLLKTWLAVIVGPVVILLSTAEFWRGSRFTLDDKRARAQRGFSTSEIQWESVASIKRFDQEMHLSPFTGESRLDSTRGVWLKFEQNKSDDIFAYVQSRVGKRVRIVDRRSGS